MRHIDVMKKRPSRGPWALGVVLLALAMWGATVLLRPPVENEAPDRPTMAADTLPPAQIPLTRDGARAEPEPPTLAELLPLGEEHMGTTLQVGGDVVATGDDAVWILAGSSVIRVDSRERARRGESLSVEGVVQPADTDMADRMTARVISREPGSEGWTVIREFKVVEKGYDESADGESDDEADGAGGTSGAGATSDGD